MTSLSETSILLGSSGVSTGFTIDQSIRFNDDDSAYLSKTWSGAGDKQKFTFSFWVKRGNITSRQILLSFRQDVPLEFEADDTLRVYLFGTTALNTNRVFRDPSAWYHIVLSVDSTESVSSERVRLYINGQRETSFSAASYPSLNASANIYTSSTENYIGRILAGSNYFDGYMAEIHFTDGYSYGPEYFGEFKTNTGIWIPKEVSDVTYGTNGYYIDGRDSSDLGDDESGQGNDFTSNNLAAHDQMLDSPTNNFCVMSSIDFTYNAIRNGNLETIGGNNNKGGRGTFGFSSGKFYWEMLATTISDGYPGSGVVYDEFDPDMPTAYAAGGTNHGAGATHNRERWYVQATSYTAYGSNPSSGDIYMYAFDRDNNKIYWGVNGTYRNSGDPAGGSGAVASSLTHYGDWMPYVNHGSNAGTSAATFNFGQDGTFAGAKTAQGNSDGNGIGNFYYSPPTGFLALCSSNLGS